MTVSKNQLFLGTFIHSKTRDQLEYLTNAAVCVDTKGTIAAVEKDCDRDAAERILYPRLGWTADTVDVRVCKETEFFFPGFVGEFYGLLSS